MWKWELSRVLVFEWKAREVSGKDQTPVLCQTFWARYTGVKTLESEEIRCHGVLPTGQTSQDPGRHPPDLILAMLLKLLKFQALIQVQAEDRPHPRTHLRLGYTNFWLFLVVCLEPQQCSSAAASEGFTEITEIGGTHSKPREVCDSMSVSM